MILVIDNFDSFTYNLVQYFGELGAKIVVKRNNEIAIDEIAGMRPQGIVLSPGPGRPEDAGITMPVIKELGGRIPILGVCLGHQAIGAVFGGKIVRAPELLHGKVSAIHHDGRGVFSGIDSPFEATRYHSLVIDAKELPAGLEVSARTVSGVIMAVRVAQPSMHKPVEGVQFHPESILTKPGKWILQNFLKMCDSEAGEH
jgi:anthranilate synthase/aminodeoxychorismate synthase-like glutamine amidotransferase